MRVTGSGLGCPDWPLCHGSLIPPFEAPVLIEYSHRLAAAVVSLLVVAVAMVALWRHRSQRSLLVPSLVALGLLVVQIVLGGVTVLLELPPTIVTAHLGTAMALLGTLTFLAAQSRRVEAGAPLGPAPVSPRLARWTVLAAYAQILIGSYVVGSGAALACPDVVDCLNGRFFIGAPLQDIQMTHRLVAFTVLVLTALLAVSGWRARREPAVRALALGVAALVVVQIALGMLNVAYLLPLGLRAAHLANAAAIFGLLVALWALVRGRPVLHVEAGGSEAEPRPRTLGQSVEAYLNLTKPGIVTLLLVTTLVAMIVAQGGWPPLLLVLATLLGGALASGGANAINCYVDREADKLMRRTRARALPSGRVQPRRALVFGLVLEALALGVMLLFTNPLAAGLAMLGAFYYAVIYTCWLKRATPQNIVIGGGAGAIPPLVGWAAVAGTLGLPALILFAIIFFWTPPHFWALSLIVRKDYESANIPMLPVVAGDAEAKRQILLYSFQLLAVTLLLFVAQAAGLLYLATAVALGAGFIVLAWLLWREVHHRWAGPLFWYSNIYLALLFLGMVVDRVMV